MSKMRSVVLIVSVLMMAGVAAVAADPNDFIVWSGDCPGRLYVPTNYNPSQSYPFVMFFHGLGEAGTDNTSQVNSNIDNLLAECKQREVFLYAPQSYNGYWPDNRVALAWPMVQQAIATYSIDANRVYVTGLSAGGAGVFNSYEVHDDAIAGAVAVCALSLGDRDRDDVLVGKPLWMFHAANDATIPVGQSRSVINGIRAQDGGKDPLTFPLDDDPQNPYYNTGEPYYSDGSTYYQENNLLYTEYDTGGHNIWGRVYGEEWMYDWLFAQTLSGDGNAAPSVDAGNDDNITLPTDTVSLNATVSDDGLPDPPATVTLTWTKRSGPGTVTFGDDSIEDTTATFSTDGTYVLRLAADDGDLTAYDELTITVNPQGQDVARKVLFIGNSFTVQNIPDAFKRLAMDAGWQPPAVTSTAVVSQTLEWHTTNQDTLDAIDEGGWDYVVLQEYSTRPTDSLTATNADPLQFKQDATWLYDRVKDSSPDAQIILYETWARHENHSDYPTDYDDRDDMQSQLNYHYHDAGENYIPGNSTASVTTDVELAPVGEAWQLNYHGVNMNLHDTDLYHANYAGRYLAAMVIYGTIYDRSVEGRGAQLGLTYEDAAYLQGIADATTELTIVGGPEGYRSDGVYQSSFEEPVIDTDGGFTNREVVGWTVNSNTTNGLTVRNSSDSMFPNTTKVSGVDRTIASPANGYQFLWINSGEVSQQLTDLQEADTEYTLTVAVGRLAITNNYYDTAYYIKLYAGDTLLGTLTGDTADITAGTFEDKVLTVTTNSQADTALPLRIFLGREGAQITSRLAFDNVRLTSSPAQASNSAPTVDAGSDDSITLPTDTVSLDGTVSDDGLPDPPAAVSLVWTQESGPGTATFGDDEAEDTTATFSEAGTYVLRLTADDGDLTAYGEVTITVNPAPPSEFVYDGFATPGDYSNGYDLAAQTAGGYGDWYGDWSDIQSNAAAGTVTSSLTYSGLTTTGGSITTSTATRLHYIRQFANDQYLFAADGEVWFSALFKRTSGGNNFGITIASGTSEYIGCGFRVDNSAYDVRASINGTLGTTNAYTSFSNGDTVLVVGRVSIDAGDTAGDHVVDIWVNPDTGVDLSNAALKSGDSWVDRAYAGFEASDRINVYCHQNNAMSYDEIRVGPNWASVVP